jgi:hypothetical protein
MTEITGLAWNTTIQNILNEFRAKQAALRSASTSSAKPDNPKEWNAAPPRASTIRSLSQATDDLQTDTPQTARAVGDLVGGKSRLNIVSALTKEDRVDFFSFNVKTAGKVGLAISSDEGVHVQILKRNGQIIADNEAKFGAKADNYKDLIATKLYLDKGEYLVKVTRTTGATNTTQPNYALQLSMGRYFTEDYETVETPALSSASTTGIYSIGAQNASATSSVLNQFAGGNLFDLLV